MTFSVHALFAIKVHLKIINFSIRRSIENGSVELRKARQSVLFVCARRSASLKYSSQWSLCKLSARAEFKKVTAYTVAF